MTIAERKAREKEELKTLILNAAKKLFVEKGIEHTTIRNIAEAIDYSVGTVYVYYKDKNAILYDITELGFDQLKEQMLPFTKIEAPMEQLLFIGKTYINFAINNKELYDLMFIMNAPVQYMKNSGKEDWEEGAETFKFLVSIVKKCINAGYFKGESAEILSLSFWGVVHGLSSLYIRRPLDITECIGMDVAIEDALEAFFNSLLKK